MFFKTLRTIIMILLNKQDFQFIHNNHAGQMLVVALFQHLQVWYYNNRQVYSAVCGIRDTEWLSLKTSEHHRNVGSFPSTPNCSLGSTEKSCRPRTAWADVDASAAQTAPVCFWFHHSTASQQANKPFQSKRDWQLGCEPRHRCRPHFPRRRLHEEMICVILPFSHLHVLIILTFTTSVFPALLSALVQSNKHLLTLIFLPHSTI